MPVIHEDDVRSDGPGSMASGRPKRVPESQLSPTAKMDIEQIKRLEQEFIELCDNMPSRESSLAKTHIETAAMWAIRAAVMRPRRDMPGTPPA